MAKDGLMEESQRHAPGGFPVLVLVGLSTALAWAFGNPFLGFVVIFALGLLVLIGVEYVRGRRRPHT